MPAVSWSRRRVCATFGPAAPCLCLSRWGMCLVLFYKGIDCTASSDDPQLSSGATRLNGFRSSQGVRLVLISWHLNSLRPWNHLWPEAFLSIHSSVAERWDDDRAGFYLRSRHGVQMWLDSVEPPNGNRSNKTSETAGYVLKCCSYTSLFILPAAWSRRWTTVDMWDNKNPHESWSWQRPQSHRSRTTYETGLDPHLFSGSDELIPLSVCHCKLVFKLSPLCGSVPFQTLVHFSSDSHEAESSSSAALTFI